MKGQQAQLSSIPRPCRRHLLQLSDTLRAVLYIYEGLETAGDTDDAVEARPDGGCAEMWRVSPTHARRQNHLRRGVDCELEIEGIAEAVGSCLRSEGGGTRNTNKLGHCRIR